MKPIYFPFTFISAKTAEIIHSFFDQLVLYQPSNLKAPEILYKMAEEKTLCLRAPVSGDEDRLRMVFKDYQNWINYHQITDTAFLKTQSGSIPFFSDTSISQIKSDIKKITANKIKKENEDLFIKRLFLYLAQEYDNQQFELDRELLLLDKLNRTFICNLKGEPEEYFNRKTFTPDDSGAFMFQHRFKAWAQLFLEDDEISAFFITNYKSAPEYILEQTKEAVKIISIDSLPLVEKTDKKTIIFKKKIVKNIDALAKNKWEPDKYNFNLDSDNETKKSDDTISLTIYIIPDKTPYEFFSGFIGKKLPELKKETPKKKFINTIIGVLKE